MLRILTFNTHEAYQYELAKTGHLFDVLPSESRGLWDVNWDVSSRPAPPNVCLLPHRDSLSDDDLGKYDVILAQTLEDFARVERASVPKVLMFHTLHRPPPEWQCAADHLRYLDIANRLDATPVVYIDRGREQSWGLPGHVIVHGVDPNDYADFPYVGDLPRVLTVAHFLRERGDVLGYRLHCNIVQDDVPHMIIGRNPGIENSRPAASWDDLRRQYQRYRVYLNTRPSGYSLALLEAAAAGMPIVTTPHYADEPFFEDRKDAYVSTDGSYLRRAIARLLNDPDEAREMGQRAKESVQKLYSSSAFVRKWQDVLGGVAAKPYRARPTISAASAPDDFFSSQLTIAHTNQTRHLKPGQISTVAVLIENRSSSVWHPCTTNGVGEVKLSYHLHSEAGDLLTWDNLWTPLPGPLGPGDSAMVRVLVRAPDATGRYQVVFDAVAQDMGWFSVSGPTVWQNASVTVVV